MSLCAECARRGLTCCEQSEVYVTPGDVRRIAAFTGSCGFCEFRPAGPEYLDQEHDPLWAQCVFRADGSRRVLRRSEVGACCFLGESGCALPMEVRPLVCRLHPYDYTLEGITGVYSDFCPTEALPPGVALTEAIGVERDAAERWHRLLYEEIRLEDHRRVERPGA